MEWQSGRSGCKTLSLVSRDSTEKNIVSFISKITVCWHFTLQYNSSLHRLTNDSSFAWSAAEHAPDHLRCLCSLSAVDTRRHPGRQVPLMSTRVTPAVPILWQIMTYILSSRWNTPLYYYNCCCCCWVFCVLIKCYVVSNVDCKAERAHCQSPNDVEQPWQWNGRVY